jgi:hypothetical protein
MRLASWLLATVSCATAAFAQDASRPLEEARDKIMAKAAHLPTYACIETIDRSYYWRTNTPDPPPSCERIDIDRKKGRSRMKLDSTDRVRVAVAVTGDREIYSWTGRAPFSYSVEDILHPGPIGTGGFASHLLAIFENPSVQFRVLGERLDATEYGFRVPIEASHYSVDAGDEHLVTGYSGSFFLSRELREIGRFSLETDELPKETSLCKTGSVLEFGNGETAAWLAPGKSTLHNVLRDASETDSVITLSDCQEGRAKPAAHASATAAPLRPGVVVTMVFNAPIDSDVAAAGDEISATIDEAHLPDEEAGDLPPLKGAVVRGRIVRVQHWTAREKQPAAFLFAIAFETLDVKGVVSPFYAKLLGQRVRGNVVPLKYGTFPGMRDWPCKLIFESPAPRYVVEAPFYSVWLTTAAGAVK